jgi:long-subunit acyl-CoA synthetase (AMP-forming)/thioester reductase-like protein
MILLNGRRTVALYRISSLRALCKMKHEPGVTLSHSFDSLFHDFQDKRFICKYDALHKQLSGWLSYGEFQKVAIQFGHQLKTQQGLIAGDRVGLLSRNSIEWYIGEYACLLYGFVSIGLPLSASRSQLSEYVDEFSIKALVAPENIISKLHASAVSTISIESIRSLYLTDTLATSPMEPLPLLPDSLLYTIILTSGTTSGKSKGVLYTREAWNRELMHHSSPSNLRGVSYLPLAHIVDRHHVAKTMFNGGEIVVVDPLHALFDTGSLAIIRPTILFTTPSLASELLTISDEDKAACTTSLSTVVCGGGTLPSQIIRAIETQLVVKVVNPYGLTDIGNIAINGKILPSIRYKLIPLADKDSIQNQHHCDNHTLDPSLQYGVGELAVFVGDKFNGYDTNTTSSTAAVDSDGYFLTGDIVRVTKPCVDNNPIFSDASIEVLGRVGKSVKLTSGEWIVPAAIEDAIMSIQYVDRPLTRDVYIESTPCGMHVLCVLSPTSSASHLTDAALLSLINHEMRSQGLHTVSRLMRSPVRFTVENGLRNDGLKIARRAIHAKFANALLESDGQNAFLGAPISSVDTVSATVAYLMSDFKSHTTEDSSTIGQMSFRNLGGDSLLALQVKHRILKEYHIDSDVLVNMLLRIDFPLVQIKEALQHSVSDSLSSSGHGIQIFHHQVELFAEEIGSNLKRHVDRYAGGHIKNSAHMHRASIWPHAGMNARTVLVTGATGFIGMHVVREICKRGSCRDTDKGIRVVCLVRRASVAAAVENFKDFLGVEVVGGDVTAPRFNLSKDAYERLLDEIDCVIHCSGNTNQSLSYSDLVDNPRGVMEVLRFGSLHRSQYPPHMVFLSTTDILPNHIPEVYPLPLDHTFNASRLSGYALSKLKEEEVIGQAISGGLKNCISICRVGLVCNSVEAKPWHVKEDFIDIILSGVRELHLAPDISEKVCFPNVVPVDTMAEWIVALSLDTTAWTVSVSDDPSANSMCSVYHLSNMNSDDMKTGMPFMNAFREFGLPVAPLSEWKSLLVRGSALYNLNCAVDLFPVSDVTSSPRVIQNIFTSKVLTALGCVRNPGVRDIVLSIKGRASSSSSSASP